MMLGSCGPTQEERDRDAALAKAQQAEKALGEAQNASAAAERRAQDAEHLAEERRRRGGTITTFTVSIVLPCIAFGSRAPEHPAFIGTLLILEGEGFTWRLIDSARTPAQVSELEGGLYSVTFNYVPEALDQIAGHNVDELTQIKTLSARYSGVLHSIGLEIDISRPLRLNVRVNGIPVVDNQDIPLLPDVASAAALSVPVESQFSAVPAAYDRGLSQNTTPAE
jgi:hypothetical protein